MERLKYNMIGRIWHLFPMVLELCCDDIHRPLKKAVDLMIRAIASATYGNSGSGDVVRVYNMHKGGQRSMMRLA